MLKARRKGNRKVYACGRKLTDFSISFIMEREKAAAIANEEFEVERLEKVIYLVRHCRASGQAPEAELTQEGEQQAQELAEFFEGKGILHIVSSPYRRALQSIRPAAKRLGLTVETDERLMERVLSTEDLPDWMEHLEQSFSDSDLKLPGGESGREAAERGMEVLRGAKPHSVLVTHGNLMALLLSHFDPDFGFREWKALANPDVYEIRLAEGEGTINRVTN